MRRWAKSPGLPHTAMSTQWMARPMAKSSTVRLNTLRRVDGVGWKPRRDMDTYIDTPMMNRKKGKTRSQGVMPFHRECCNISNDSP